MSLNPKGDFLMHGVVLQNRVFRPLTRDVSRETFLRKSADRICFAGLAALYSRARPNTDDRIVNVNHLLKSFGLDPGKAKSGDLVVSSPIDGSEIARLKSHTPAQVGAAIAKAHGAFQAWREVPAPKRGELIRF